MNSFSQQGSAFLDEGNEISTHFKNMNKKFILLVYAMNNHN
jgi:hypothetical protein